MTGIQMCKYHSKWLVRKLKYEHIGREWSTIDMALNMHKGLAIFQHYYNGWDYKETLKWGLNNN